VKGKTYPAGRRLADNLGGLMALRTTKPLPSFPQRERTARDVLFQLSAQLENSRV